MIAMIAPKRAATMPMTTPIKPNTSPIASAPIPIQNGKVMIKISTISTVEEVDRLAIVVLFGSA